MNINKALIDDTRTLNPFHVALYKSVGLYDIDLNINDIITCKKRHYLPIYQMIDECNSKIINDSNGNIIRVDGEGKSISKIRISELVESDHIIVEDVHINKPDSMLHGSFSHEITRIYNSDNVMIEKNIADISGKIYSTTRLMNDIQYIKYIHKRLLKISNRLSFMLDVENTPFTFYETQSKKHTYELTLYYKEYTSHSKIVQHDHETIDIITHKVYSNSTNMNGKLASSFVQYGRRDDQHQLRYNYNEAGLLSSVDKYIDLQRHDFMNIDYDTSFAFTNGKEGDTCVISIHDLEKNLCYDFIEYK